MRKKKKKTDQSWMAMSRLEASQWMARQSGWSLASRGVSTAATCHRHSTSSSSCVKRCDMSMSSIIIIVYESLRHATVIHHHHHHHLHKSLRHANIIQRHP
eukprot:3288793-Rhodomonas_salina.1